MKYAAVFGEHAAVLGIFSAVFASNPAENRSVLAGFGSGFGAFNKYLEERELIGGGWYIWWLIRFVFAYGSKKYQVKNF